MAQHLDPDLVQVPKAHNRYYVNCEIDILHLERRMSAGVISSDTPRSPRAGVYPPAVATADRLWRRQFLCPEVRLWRQLQSSDRYWSVHARTRKKLLPEILTIYLVGALEQPLVTFHFRSVQQRIDRCLDDGACECEPSPSANSSLIAAMHTGSIAFMAEGPAVGFEDPN